MRLPSKKGLDFLLAPNRDELLRDALRRTQSVGRAAKFLGITKRTIHSWCKADPTLRAGLALAGPGRPKKPEKVEST